ncbi:fungal-specific transcription factor domain-containing protein [Trichoderma asperelloides]|nr:fungal-specific transcription factor domain-containing protein [Trichoderma asperelloides]
MARAEKRCNGCWTCRLRRKRCDETRPECANCSGLQITCHYGMRRPTWFDGAKSQEAMAAQIKSQIKEQAGYRRERHHASTGVARFAKEARIRGHNFINLIPKNDGSNGEIKSHNDATNGVIPQDAVVSSSKCKIPDNAPGFNFANKFDWPGPDPDMLFYGEDYDMDFLMKYLDNVFPLIFPFYKTPLLGPGRGWIFSFLSQSKVAFHSVLGISSYIFTVALSEAYPGEEHKLCKALVWSRLVRQANMCFDMLQQDIQELNNQGEQANLLDKVRVMESIVQFLTFEVALGRSANWDNHLSPTIALFLDILQNHTEKTSASILLGILSKINQRPLYALKEGYYVWDNRQECFRFFTGLLLFIDVVASTSLERPPQLLEYHLQLLSNGDDGNYDKGEATIRLSNLIGCRNWAICVIAEISVLDAWKKENMRKGVDYGTELIERANRIDRMLEDGGSRMGGDGAAPTENSTKIWGYAARIYLRVVTSGWLPLLPEVRSSVSRALQLLQTMAGSSQLRALAWPLCVVGCMADHTQEQAFRNLFAELDKPTMIGTLDEALRVMESVWQIRGSMDSEVWDIQACLNILGTPSLLA